MEFFLDGGVSGGWTGRLGRGFARPRPPSQPRRLRHVHDSPRDPGGCFIYYLVAGLVAAIRDFHWQAQAIIKNHKIVMVQLVARFPACGKTHFPFIAVF